MKGRTGKLLNNQIYGCAAKFIDSSDNRFLIRGSDQVQSRVLVQGVPDSRGGTVKHRKVKDERVKNVESSARFHLPTVRKVVYHQAAYEFTS